MSCKYADMTNGGCILLKDRCPFVYYCDKRQMWRENSNMPTDCKIKERHDVPKGWHKVELHKHGYLYIAMDGFSIKLPNPYSYIPSYVKLYQSKNNWIIKEGMEANGRR